MEFRYEFKAQDLINQGRISREGVEEVQKWIKSENLPEVCEEFIVLCLLSCRNVVEDAKNTIAAYFRIKREAPEIFNNRDIDSEDLRKASKVVSCISIPRRIPPNTVIHFFKINDTSYQNFDWILSMKLAYMLLDISQRRNPPNDLVVVADMKGLGLMHLAKLKIHAVKKFLEFLQEAMPLKIKTIHILNTTYIFDKLISFARIFIKSELMEIIKTHSPGADASKLEKEGIPISCLPKDYGGDLQNSEELNRNCIEKFRELKGYFKAEEKLIQFGK